MIKIGIVCDRNNCKIEKTLTEICRMSDISVFSYKNNSFRTFKDLAFDATDVFIAPIDTYLLEKKKEFIDILVFSDKINITSGKILNLVAENAIVICNSDDSNVTKYLKGSRSNVLTYGFNSKSSVTASSIEENMERKFIQVCIQRSFRSIFGQTIEAQEIPFTLKFDKDGAIMDEIAAITAALSIGINLRTITLAY